MKQANGFFIALKNMATHSTVELLGGPKPWKLSWIINFQKAGTFLFLLQLMWIYQNFSVPVWIYLAMHGTYGLVWVLKDITFPDPSWQQKCTIAGGLMAFFGVLFWYWMFGWILISEVSTPEYPLSEGLWYCLCISMCMLGSVIMMVADAQKFYTLKYRKSLITTGIHKHIRHPNYLGEMMIYLSFALMVYHWLPFVVLAVVWTLVFIPNMVAKEQSLSRYPEFLAYKKRTWWVLPFIL